MVNRQRWNPVGARLRVIGIACLIIAWGIPADSASDTGYTLLRELQNAQLLPTEQAAVRNLTLTHQDIEFHFESGVISRPAPVEGKITGLYFSGQGWAAFKPSDPIAADLLSGLAADKSGSERCSFDRLYSRFADWNDLSFSEPPVFAPVSHPQDQREVSRQMERWLAARMAQRQDNIALSLNHPYLEIFRDLTEGRGPGSFYVVYNSRDTRHGADRFYRYEPGDPEEIAYNGWCRYSKRTPEASRADQSEPAVQAMWYDISATIDSSGHIDFSVEERFIVRAPSPNYIFSYLAPIFEVDKVTDKEGVKLEYISGRDENDFQGICVFLQHPPAVGDTLTLHFAYSGSPAEASSCGRFYLPPGLAWYPTVSTFCRATFDVRFSFPSSMSLVASGRKVGEKETPGRKHSYWVQGNGTSDFSFGFGTCESKEYFYDGLPPLTIFAPNSIASDIRNDRQKEIAVDVLNNLGYFKKLYGPFPFENLTVIEVPNENGAAFAGLVHVPQHTLAARSQGGFPASPGHELAQQWWGYIVREKTYHDRWITDGVAEYSAALYAEKSSKRGDIFRAMLRQWRNEIFSAEQQETAVSPTGGIGASTDYADAKAAYIMHMLRVMMMDLDIGSDWRFTAMLRDLLEFYRGEEITSMNFENQAELYYGAPLDWFFDQWVQGSRIPTYASRYQIDQRPDGQYVVLLEVEQTGVDDSFKMPVPVSVVFHYRRPHRTRIWVSGPWTAVELGPFEQKPDQVIFNDFNGILARRASAPSRIAETK